MRGHRLVQIVFRPLRFDPEANRLDVTKRVQVNLRFPAGTVDGAEAAAERGWDPDDPLVSLLRNTVVNSGQVGHLARTDRPPAVSSEPLSAGAALAAPPAGTEYLIIAHSDFLGAVAPLAAHRANHNGLQVFSTTAGAIYSAYGDGSVNPDAIKQYIAQAYYQDEPPELKYVLLVGDGVSETQVQAQGISSSQNFIPPYLVTMSPVWCIQPFCMPWEAPSDHEYVAGLDSDGDQIADVAIGRLPVNSVAEATTVVEKIVAYEQNPPGWPWNERVLFFAGNESGGADEQYHDFSDEIYRDHLPDNWTGQRVYFCTSDCDQPHQYEDMQDAHDRTVQALNGGGLLASYVGHSSWQQWAVDPKTFAPMFHVEDDVPGLHNGGALPVVLEMTCYTSDFSHPTDVSLDESLVRKAGGGAVATWGGTTVGLSLGHTILHEGFFDAVFQGGITELGPATQAAQLHLLSENPYYVDLVDTFVLLGDPAMELNMTIVPWAAEVFLPAALRGN
jgi:hypothetical protein